MSQFDAALDHTFGHAIRGPKPGQEPEDGIVLRESLKDKPLDRKSSGELGHQRDQQSGNAPPLILVNDDDREFGSGGIMGEPNHPGNGHRLVVDHHTPGNMVVMIDLGEIGELGPGQSVNRSHKTQPAGSG
jgi:hypothetical protein